jgi:hypothetical protein
MTTKSFTDTIIFLLPQLNVNELNRIIISSRLQRAIVADPKGVDEEVPNYKELGIDYFAMSLDEVLLLQGIVDDYKPDECDDCKPSTEEVTIEMLDQELDEYMNQMLE